MSRIVIFVNGILPKPAAAKKILRPDDFLLGADGGARFIMQIGLMPNLVIGDLDSLTTDELAKLAAAHIETIKYPTDKNETDLELALHHALALNPDAVIIAAALGGRMDQTLANISLLTDESLSKKDIRLDDGVEEILLCRDESQIHGNIGDTVSLLPWNGIVNGITTANLKWALNSETLFPQKTRGVSNEMTAQIATVKIQSGLLLIIHRRNS